MAQTAIVPIELSSLYPTAMDTLTFTPGDVANGNKFQLTGREIILVRNVSVDTDFDFTVPSTPDSLGRTGDLVDTVPFGATMICMLGVRGWKQDDGQLYMTVEDASLEIAVVRFPS